MSFASLITLNDNLLAAMDVETTGRNPCHHEVIQLAIVLADCHLEPVGQFYTNIKPNYPDRMAVEAVETHGLTCEMLESCPDKFQVADSLWDWFQELSLPPGKRLIPLCHNSQFDIPFVQQMLGLELWNDIFGYPSRDTQAAAVARMDSAAFNNVKTPYSYVKLSELCKVYGVKLDDAHDALADALATLRVYKAMMSDGKAF